jgi:non-specific protein-tyrosine kinase
LTPRTEVRRPADWLTPAEEEAGLRRYVEVLVDRRWIVIVTTALALLLGAGYLLYAEPVYEAEAQLLVTPASENDPALSTLGLLRESTDPARDVETAAQLTTTINVARRVAQGTPGDVGADDLLDLVSAAPVAQSNIVVITAEGDSAREAATLANAFANAAVAERTNQLHDQIERILPGLRSELESVASPDPTTPTATETELGAQIVRLETLANADDPTIRVETEADPPDEQASPKPLLTIVAAFVGGLLISCALAYTAHALDRRLRHEDQLRRRYRLPILARIPKTRDRSRPLAPSDLPGAATEGYRTLRSTAVASARTEGAHEGGRVILVTGAAPGDGKTTTAVNLATSLALSGKSVVLIESDLRRPMIGAALGVETSVGIVNVLIENVTLEEALVDDPTYHGNLRLLLADHHGTSVSELLSLPAARELIRDARRLADFVIVDSPPLATVVDSLPLARAADEVLIVVRIGNTPLDTLNQLAELLHGEGISPMGFVLIAAQRPRTGKDYYYGAGERRLWRRDGGSNGASAGERRAATPRR